MTDHDWVKEASAAIVVCDSEGVILEVNDRYLEFSQSETAQERKRDDLIGMNVIDCHSKSTQPKVSNLLKSGKIHTSMIERDGTRYLIYYAPWYTGGKYSGQMELILQIPPDYDHLFREPA